MGSYWMMNNGTTNGLRGAETTQVVTDRCNIGPSILNQRDETNPCMLSDSQILYALAHSRIARRDFERIFPTLLPEEQQRLTTLLEKNPLESKLVVDPQQQSDQLQKQSIRRIPIRWCGSPGRR